MDLSDHSGDEQGEHSGDEQLVGRNGRPVRDAVRRSAARRAIVPISASFFQPLADSEEEEVPRVRRTVCSEV